HLRGQGTPVNAWACWRPYQPQHLPRVHVLAGTSLKYSTTSNHVLANYPFLLVVSICDNLRPNHETLDFHRTNGQPYHTIQLSSSRSIRPQCVFEKRTNHKPLFISLCFTWGHLSLR
ncbi:unnamed protein product, partial [Ectocarpus fasciculatus]